MNRGSPSRLNEKTNIRIVEGTSFALESEGFGTEGGFVEEPGMGPL